MSAHVLSLAAAEEATRELPMPLIAFFLITFALFVLLLGITWSFRNTAYKVQAPRPQSEQRAAGSAVQRDGSHH